MPRTGWDIASIDGLNRPPSQRYHNVSVPSSRLDASAPTDERPCALKVDVEGSEPSALRGAARLLRDRPPRALLLEYTPGAPERAAAAGGAGALDRYGEHALMLRQLRDAGYRLFLLDAANKGHAGGAWPPRLLEVDAAAIAAEALNARRMWHAYSSDGFAFPDDLERGSLRAEFPYNTDLLALHVTAEPDVSQLVAASPGGLSKRVGPRWADGRPSRRAEGFRERPPPNHVSCWWRDGCFFREGHGLLQPRPRATTPANLSAPGIARGGVAIGSA